MIQAQTNVSSSNEGQQFQQRRRKLLVLYENTCTWPKTLANATENEESGREGGIVAPIGDWEGRG